MAADFSSQEEAEHEKEDLLAAFLDDVTRAPSELPPERTPVNEEREAMIQALFQVGPRRGAAMPPPAPRPVCYLVPQRP
jgi:hypothetical protein